jgi:hypothetical protein
MTRLISILSPCDLKAIFQSSFNSGKTNTITTMKKTVQAREIRLRRLKQYSHFLAPKPLRMRIKITVTTRNGVKKDASVGDSQAMATTHGENTVF